MEIIEIYTPEGLEMFELLGIWYCGTCGARVINTKEWRLNHYKKCQRTIN